MQVGETPAGLAARFGRTDLIEAMADQRPGKVQARADLSVPSSDSVLDGGRAFLLARLGQTEQAQLLLQGWSKEQWHTFDSGSGDTILHAALEGGSLLLVQYILQQAPELSKTKNQRPRDLPGSDT